MDATRGTTIGDLRATIHYPWSTAALEMLREMDSRFRASMIQDCEACARCLGEPAVTPYVIREARCSLLDD